MFLTSTNPAKNYEVVGKVKISTSQEIKQAVYHELGHLFGLVPETRNSVNESLGIHCNNICIMRQGLSIDEWINITNHRLEYGILCSPCSIDIKDYFSK